MPYAWIAELPTSAVGASHRTGAVRAAEAARKPAAESHWPVSAGRGSVIKRVMGIYECHKVATGISVAYCYCYGYGEGS
jgi:hypothetical protein